MEDILVVIVTFVFLLYGSRWIKKVDFFLEENSKATLYERVYLETPLLLSPLSFLSSLHPSVQFKINNISRDHVYMEIQEEKIEVAIFVTPCTDLSEHSFLCCEKVLLPLEQLDIYNTIYIVYRSNFDSKIVSTLLSRCRR